MLVTSHQNLKDLIVLDDELIVLDEHLDGPCIAIVTDLHNLVATRENIIWCPVTQQAWHYAR